MNSLLPGSLHTRLPQAQKGNAKIVHDSPDMLTRLRAARDGQPLRASTYTRLFVGGVLWMTDADFECMTNAIFIRKAAGDVLICGLGLGLVLGPCLIKPSVSSVTVIEKSLDVVDLISPHYTDSKLKVITADARTWKPPQKAYDLVYLDIWSDVPNSDTLDDIVALKRHYKPSLKPKGKILAWCEDYAKK